LLHFHACFFMIKTTIQLYKEKVAVII
jgi:hypothetical protein